MVDVRDDRQPARNGRSRYAAVQVGAPVSCDRALTQLAGHLLRILELAVDDHIEDTARSRDQLRLDIERLSQLCSQTDRGGFVVSGGAVGYRNIHSGSSISGEGSGRPLSGDDCSSFQVIQCGFRSGVHRVRVFGLIVILAAFPMLLLTGCEPAEKPESIPESISSEQEVTTAPALEPTVEIFQQRNHFWVWVSLFLACGWLASGILWWFSRRRSVSTVAKRNDQTPSLHSVNKILKAACINNDAKATRNALLSWANAMVLSDSFDNLNSVGHYFGDPLKAEINSLNQSLYGIEQTDWSGEVLWQTCEKITTEVKPVVQVEEDELVALNP